jgi:hypothetical protein
MFFNTPSFPPSIHPSSHPSLHRLFRPSSIHPNVTPRKTNNYGFVLTFTLQISISISCFHSLSFSCFHCPLFVPLHSFTLLHSPKLCFTISLPFSLSHSLGKGRKCAREGRAFDKANTIGKEVRTWQSLSTTT